MPRILHRLHSLRDGLVAITTAAAVLSATACGGAVWPNRAVGVTTIPFAHHQLDVGTIDVLPLDLQAWVEPGYQGDLGEVQAEAEADMMNVALDTLAKRNYRVGAVIDRNGVFPGGTALSGPDLVATVGALSRYGAAAAQHPGRLPIPYLPARLGTATGADATLYVGGWAYVANDHESTGEQIGKAILIGLAIVAVVAIIVVLADSHHGSPHGSAHHGGGGHIGGGPGFHGGFHHGAFHPVAGVLDVFGRAAIDVTLATSDWRDDASLPHSGDEAQMYVEMTLVDNRTGLALWHAHQQFPARLGSSADTARVMHTLLDLLPPHVAAVARP